MRVPFHRELDEVFQSDRSIWLKMSGCAFATVFVVITAIVRGIRDGRLNIRLSPPLIAGMAGISAASGALLALVLSLKDVVRRRVIRGEPVNPVLKIYFGMGLWSLVAWFPTLLIVGFFIAIATAL